MIQEVGGHQQLKIWKLLQKFMKWCQDTVDLETGGGSSALCGRQFIHFFTKVWERGRSVQGLFYSITGKQREQGNNL
jgi:hypothetical protein